MSKKQKGAKQSPPKKERIESPQKLFWSNKMYLQAIWASITVISVLLNFYLAYLMLRPKIIIDYASHLIPENPIALPIKISNQGFLPIYNVICLVEDKDIHDK